MPPKMETDLAKLLASGGIRVLNRERDINLAGSAFEDLAERAGIIKAAASGKLESTLQEIFESQAEKDVRNRIPFASAFPWIKDENEAKKAALEYIQDPGTFVNRLKNDLVKEIDAGGGPQLVSESAKTISSVSILMMVFSGLKSIFILIYI